MNGQSDGESVQVPFGETDLTLCQREPIHIPGSIQPYGVLLAFGRDDFTIRQFAGDTRFLLGIDPMRMPQLSLYILFNEQVLMPIAEKLRASPGIMVPSIQAGVLSRTGAMPLDLTLHAQGDTGILEVEPARRAVMDGRDPIMDVKQMLAAVANADSFLSCCAATAKTVRAATAFDRVMIYQFLHDGSGCVIAEDKAHGLDSYLGLHYPASDIPPQARELYRRNWLRLIPDIDYTPAPLEPAGPPGGKAALDMTYCFLRSVSPLHIEYLRNMGVTASMSISIVHQDKLWGLIACHNYTPHYVSADLRISCELFAQVFSLHLAAKIEAERVGRRYAAQKMHERLTSDLAGAEDIAARQVAGEATLLDLLPAGGAAVWLNGRLATVGCVPPEPAIIRLIEWLDTGDEAIFHTHELPALFPPSGEHADSACGLLAIASERWRRDYVLWFRPEVIETVTWGGEPDKLLQQDEHGLRVSPRKSFEAWREEVRNQSVPWTDSDVEIARAFRVSLLETILRQVDAAQREREAIIQHQNLLMAELDHRVKNILATISAVIQLSKHDGIELETYIQTLQNRIKAMATAHDLLAAARWHDLSLRSLLNEELAPYASDSRIAMNGVDVMLAPRAALSLSLVIHELATNAAKYGALSGLTGTVTIAWAKNPRGDIGIEWTETGGPAVTLPYHRGFGSRLIERSLGLDVGGSAKLHFEPTGVVCRMVLPAEHVAIAT